MKTTGRFSKSIRHVPAKHDVNISGVTADHMARIVSMRFHMYENDGTIRFEMSATEAKALGESLIEMAAAIHA